MVFTMRARIADNFSTMFSTILMQGGVHFVPLLIFVRLCRTFSKTFLGVFQGTYLKKSRPDGRQYTIHLSTIHYTLHHSFIFQKLLVIADAISIHCIRVLPLLPFINSAANLHKKSHICKHIGIILQNF
jgi:hypothetical protein